ncbi:MAG: hypothetical protein H0T78_09590 [Longispora sp.]|nr:hypothetical protein [Longispora sp. (in: high G+C Gram-positive bacteria)]
MSAIVALHEGRMSLAADFTEAARSVQPFHEGALITRALILTSMDDLDAALAYAADLATVYPGEAYPMMVASAVFSVAGGGQLALDTAWAAVQLAPEDPDAHWLLGRIATRMELTDLARDALGRARELMPLPGRRTGVWKLWWERYGAVDVAPPTVPSSWRPVLMIAAVVLVAGLVLAWLVAS